MAEAYYSHRPGCKARQGWRLVPSMCDCDRSGRAAAKPTLPEALFDAIEANRAADDAFGGTVEVWPGPPTYVGLALPPMPVVRDFVNEAAYADANAATARWQGAMVAWERVCMAIIAARGSDGKRGANV